MRNYQSLAKYFIFLIAIVIVATLNTAHSKTKEEVDLFFEKMANNVTAERSKYSDPVTEVIKVEYDKKKTELNYYYTTTAIQDGVKLDDNQVLIAKTLVTDAGCKSLGAFMRLYNLKIKHIYYNKSTNNQVMKFEITKNDCKK
jgi:hypothetical protein